MKNICTLTIFAFTIILFLFPLHVYSQNIEEMNKKELRLYIGELVNKRDSTKASEENLSKQSLKLDTIYWNVQNNLNQINNSLESSKSELQIITSSLENEHSKKDSLVALRDSLEGVLAEIRRQIVIEKAIIDSLNSSKSNLKSENSILVSDEGVSKWKSVQIGKQTWMSENLNLITFKNGDPIPYAESDYEWSNASLIGEPAWCYYNNDPGTKESVGIIYNWYAVNDPRGLAPSGWHVASDSEWKTMISFLGGNKSASGKLKSKVGWDENKYGNNSSGFNAKPCSSRIYDGEFTSGEEHGSWWTSSEQNDENAIFRQLVSYSDESIKSLTSLCFDNGYIVECNPDLKSNFYENVKQTRVTPKSEVMSAIYSVGKENCKKGVGLYVRCIKD